MARTASTSKYSSHFKKRFIEAASVVENMLELESVLRHFAQAIGELFDGDRHGRALPTRPCQNRHGKERMAPLRHRAGFRSQHADENRAAVAGDLDETAVFCGDG